MASEVRPPPKGLPAFAALIGFLLGVNPLMLQNIRLTVKGLPALAAVEDFSSSLVSQGMSKAGVTGEGPFTLTSVCSALLGVGLLVQAVGRHALESLVTQTTLVGLHPAVDFLMPDTVGAPAESFATHPALERFLLCVKPLVTLEVRTAAEGPATVTALIS